MKLNNRQQGILFIILAALFFGTMNVFVRLSGDLPTMQKAFFRNAIAALIGLWMVRKNHCSLRLEHRAVPDLLCRCLFGTMGILCNFYAVDHLPLADANMLGKMSPFFAIIASYFLLREHASKLQWISVFIAFSGALLILKPSFQISFFYGLIGLLGGFGAGVAYTFVRRLGKKAVPGPVIVMYFSLFSSLVTVPYLVLSYHPMTPKQVLYLLAAGLMAAGGQLSVTKAYQKAPARETSVYDYTQIVYAAILGFFLFHEIPDILSLIGYIVILSVAVFTWKHELREA